MEKRLDAELIEVFEDFEKTKEDLQELISIQNAREEKFQEFFELSIPCFLN